MIIRKEHAVKIDFDGLNIMDYTSGLDELSSFAVINVPKNVRHKLSWSKRSDKYYYVIEGEIKFSIDSDIVVLYQGDFCIIKKGTRFFYHNESDHDVRLILVHTPDFDINEEVFE